ncbi:uncharacterized protein LOC109602681 [Aethina tumida]|uniref:uncharacterized protein LOC109602681 n=1 Tax=Aethina tumida TaxID=116153 RepID=UPI00096AF7FF|nr:uncharacterized protein LOC109602681 [Aethina tumida]
MSSINTGYCEIVGPVGTGDCDYMGSEARNDHELAQIIASDVVNEILDNAMGKVMQENSQIGDNVTGPHDLDCIIDAMDKVTDDEMEKKKNEAIKVPIKGTGDQLESTKEVVPDDKKERHPTVEKKSRLTDLVKNSKQLLSKYILNDNIRHDNPEDDYAEKVLKVVELSESCAKTDLSNPGGATEDPNLIDESKDPFKSSEDDGSLDDIQLEKQSVDELTETMKKTMTFPMAGSSSTKSFSMASKYKTLKMTASEIKKKKWNIGAKFLNYLRKHKAKKDVAVMDNVDAKTE